MLDLFQKGPNRRVGSRYLLRTTLSSGRISAVYRAEDAEHPGTEYAVKEFSAVAMFRSDERRALDSRFHATVNRWRNLEHPALPRILDVFSAGESYYVVSEYVRGWSMERIIAEGRVRVTPHLAANWGAQVADLLEYLHGQDPALYTPFLSPGHVIVDAQGQVHLVDWGLTHLFLPTANQAYGSVAGYSAPELKTEPPSVRSDVFALGRLLYALLVGRLLEKGLPRNLPLQRAAPDAPTTLVKAIARAAHRDPARRFASAAEFSAELWTEMDGPLEPIAGWSHVTSAPAPSQAPPRATRPAPRAPGEAGSMADLGFERDPRFGAGPAQPRERPRPAEAARPEPPKVAKLSVQPRHARLPDLGASETRRVVISLHNAGEVPIAGRIVSHVGWVTAPSRAFELPVDRQAKVIVSVHAKDLQPGQTSEPQAISIETNAGRQWVAITADVPTGPSLQVEPAHLDFGEVQGEGERSLPLTLTNDGRQPLTGRITSRVEWLRLARQEFHVAPQSQAAIGVTIVPERLPSGRQVVSEALVIDSDAGQERIEARAWVRRPVLDMEPAHLDLGDLLSGQVGEAHVRVANPGDGHLEGAVRSFAPWLQVHPQQFVCEAGQAQQVTVSVDTAGLNEGPIALPEALRVHSNAGAQTVSVRLRVLAPRMLLNTTHIAFGEVAYGQREERRLRIENGGSAPLEASLQPLVGWLEPGETEITVPPGGEHVVVVRANTEAFEHGAQVIEQPALRIAAGAAIQDITVSLTVLRAMLRIEPEVLDFGYSDPTQPAVRTLRIANDGTGVLAWNLQSDATWAEFEPLRGVCRAGEVQEVRAAAYGLALEEGVESAEATLVVNSDAGRAKVPLRFAVASPRLACDTTFLDLGESRNYGPVGGSFRVFNYGLGLLRGSVRTDHTWLVVDRASFECETGRSVEIRVTTDMDEFPADAVYGEGYVFLESNGGAAEVQAVVNVILEPDVHPTAESVVLTSGAGGDLGGRLSLRNDGMATAHLELQPSAPEIILSRDLCDIKPGKRVRISVRWEGEAPTDDAERYIESRAQDGSVLRVPVVLEQPDEPANPGADEETEA